MRKALICRLLILILLLLPSIAFSETIAGKVIKVADGDTITILTPGNKQIKIRLSAVDTPEGGQAYGKKAKQFTSRMVYKKNVRVDKETTDRYGRTVGFVYVDGANLSEQIIRNGYGWVYRKYCKGAFCDDWLDLEKQARNAGIGLWAGDNIPQAPWEWRSAKRNGGKNKVAVIGGAGIYHGNVKSHVLHGSRCKYYNCKNCTAIFGSVDEAMKAGYRKHKQCVE
jgi:micrococcal nuclease